MPRSELERLAELTMWSEIGLIELALNYAGVGMPPASLKRLAEHTMCSGFGHPELGVLRAGVTVPRAKLERLAELTAAAGAWLILDNTYGTPWHQQRSFDDD